MSIINLKKKIYFCQQKKINFVFQLLTVNNKRLADIYKSIASIKNKNKYIFGICTINYELKKRKVKININHISTSIEFNQEKNNYYLKDIKHIFDLIIKYIKNEFYFDEIILEYDTNKTNEDILNIFLNDFNF